MGEKNKGKSTVELVYELTRPVTDELGLVLWDVRFLKEGSSWYLRIIIDKEDGNIDFDDCEAVSRRVDKLLDEKNPIEQSYFLEVSSPGLCRELVKDWHFDRYIGEEVIVRFIRPVENDLKEIIGVLKASDSKTITIDHDNSELVVNKAETAFIKVNDDITF